MTSRLGILAAALVVGPWSVLAAQNTPQNAPRPATGDRARSTTTRVANTRTNLGTAMVEAAERGDLATVKSLLAQGADATVARGDGMTALHWAADRGDAAMATALLRAGAKLDAKTNVGGYTPLHVASKSGRGAVVKALLEGGADAGTITGTGATALHLAAASGSAEAVDALLKHKANPNAQETAWGQTPLMFAAENNRADAIRVLVKAGADPSVKTRSVNLNEELARTQAAAKKRNEVLLASLPEKQRDSIKAVMAKAAADAAARNSFAPAAPAAAPGVAAAPDTNRGGGAGAGAQFVARGGSPTPPTDLLKPSQIQDAILAGRAVFSAPVAAKAPEQGELLEGNVAGYEGTVGSMGGMTALHHAARQGNIAAAMALVDGGAAINAPTSTDSTTPLVMAAINGQFDLAMQLVKRGADVKLATTAGLTPLYAVLNTQWAPRSRYPQPQAVQTQQVTHIELMQAMLKGGADVNVRLKKNLWFFAYNNCGNANCGLEMLDGTTPFWRAAYAVDLDAMRMLKAAGADDTMPSFRAAGAGGRGGRAGGGGAVPGAGGQVTGAAGAAAFARGGGAGGADGPGNAGVGPIDAATDSAMKAVPPGTGTYPIHSAAGVGYGNGFAGNSHRHAPDGWMPALKYLVEELHHDVNKRDLTGYTPLHHAAARGDNEMILYLVSKGADVKAVARNGRTTVDMANGPVQRLRPFPETILLLEKLGAKNSHRCVSC
ncbi:MAG: ankyrin repeat domain-containing protein [Gemmatimonadaceae bacterium]|nr:ankyrin repeat domain-containing protein [Gemmatimonadaceae bacterium]